MERCAHRSLTSAVGCSHLGGTPNTPRKSVPTAGRDSSVLPTSDPSDRTDSASRTPAWAPAEQELARDRSFNSAASCQGRQEARAILSPSD
ncbi:hypothetical protein NDU88_006940 [Pleurodeles waltl]|uniref:Uncharacterized protein n=1 Tax=Pleurodeles waltl TaxID=8319 RepID=A0AAV7SQX1_PLEWA|nr:hypothetical protein NDU88_006940 [Pleurodeles waltl]